MKITAAVSRGASVPFTIEELELDDPRENEILVKILGVGLCHTDLFMKSTFPPMPAVFGHEGAGIVEAVGSKVKKVQPGDHVVLSFRTCGECPTCKSGESTYCMNFSTYNVSGRRIDGSATIKKGDEEIFGNFFGQSSFANFVLAEEQNVVKVSKDLPIELLGPLGCGIQTGVGTVINTFNPKAGSSIVVFGAGSVGQSAIMAANAVGCTTIIAVDIFESRLAMAKEFGATHTINGKEQDPVKTIIEICGGIGAQYSIETTGNEAVIRQAIDCLFRRGTCALLALSTKSDMILSYSNIKAGRVVRGVTEGDAMPDIFIPRMLELYKQGKLPFDKMFKKYPLSEINQAVEDSEKGRMLKAILIP